MNRFVIVAVIKMCTKVILLTAAAGIVIGIIGRLNQWRTALQYSNAFFIAGSLLIIAGTASRLGAGEDWAAFQRIHAESLRDMSPGERANFIVQVSSPVSLLILGLLSGVLLIFLSWFVMRVF